MIKCTQLDNKTCGRYPCEYGHTRCCYYCSRLVTCFARDNGWKLCNKIYKILASNISIGIKVKGECSLCKEGFDSNQSLIKHLKSKRHITKVLKEIENG